MRTYDYDRVRKIVRLAADQVKNPSSKSWLMADERGTWEKTARDLLEDPRTIAAREKGMSEDTIDEEIANRLAYLALTAAIENVTKNLAKKRKR